MTTQASSLAHDLITLAELQTKLLCVDLQEAGSQSAVTLAILGAMGVLALSAGSVMLSGLAELLVEYAHWNRGAAFAGVGGMALVIVALAGWLSVCRLLRAIAVFTRSQQELQANVDFVKSLVAGPNGPHSPATRTPDRRRA